MVRRCPAWAANWRAWASRAGLTRDSPASPVKDREAPGSRAGAWSIPGELSDGFLGAGVVDEVLARGGGGDERGDGGVVERAGQPVGDAVQPGDRVIGEQRFLPPGQGQVVAE